jgi:hypothetical protein
MMRKALLLTICVFLLPVLLDAEFIICGTDGIQLEPAIGFDGVGYLVLWTDARTALTSLYGARVTQTGVVLDTVGVKVLSELNLQAHASLAFDGSNFLVAWQFGC